LPRCLLAASIDDRAPFLNRVGNHPATIQEASYDHPATIQEASCDHPGLFPPRPAPASARGTCRGSAPDSSRFSRVSGGFHLSGAFQWASTRFPAVLRRASDRFRVRPPGLLGDASRHVVPSLPDGYPARTGTAQRRVFATDPPAVLYSSIYSGFLPAPLLRPASGSPFPVPLRTSSIEAPRTIDKLKKKKLCQ
jgi:hypothetical protein